MKITARGQIGKRVRRGYVFGVIPSSQKYVLLSSDDSDEHMWGAWTPASDAVKAPKGFRDRYETGAFPDASGFGLDVAETDQRLLSVWKRDGKERTDLNLASVLKLTGNTGYFKKSMALVGKSLLAIALDDGVVHLVDVAKKKKVGALPGHKPPKYGCPRIAALSRGRLVAADSKTVRVWDALACAQLAEVKLVMDPDPPHRVTAPIVDGDDVIRVISKGAVHSLDAKLQPVAEPFADKARACAVVPWAKAVAVLEKGAVGLYEARAPGARVNTIALPADDDIHNVLAFEAGREMLLLGNRGVAYRYAVAM